MFLYTNNDAKWTIRQRHGNKQLESHWRIRDGGPGRVRGLWTARYAHQTGNVNRAFSLTWPASMHIYWNKRKRSHNIGVLLPQDWLFWDTNMAAVTSCENTLALKLRVARLLARK